MANNPAHLRPLHSADLQIASDDLERCHEIGAQVDVSTVAAMVSSMIIGAAIFPAGALFAVRYM